MTYLKRAEKDGYLYRKGICTLVSSRIATL